MTFEEWEEGVAPELRADPLWTTKAYRLACYLSHCVEEDAPMLRSSVTAGSVLPQLVSAVGSIGANIAEGYSRSGPRDRAKFFEYALSSAREARHWLFTSGSALGTERYSARLGTLTEAIRLLTTMVIRQRPH